MSKLLLPIDHNPVFISRYESAVPFSVIQAQQISIEPLIATQMMNFHYSQNFVWEFDTIKDMTWYSDCKLFFKYLYTFDCHIPGWSKSDIQEILLFALNHGRYIHSKVDTFYFPEDESFDTFHRVTECLIYGCDDEREIFYCLRFLPDTGIVEYAVPYGNLIDSICNRLDGKVSFYTLEFNEKFESSLDVKKLYNGVTDFLNSTSRCNSLVHAAPVVQGVASFQKFMEYLTQVGLYYEYIDRKYYTAFYDFQTAMQIRYSYLRKIGIVTFNQYDKILIAFMEHAKDFLHDCENYNRNRNKMLIKDIIQDVNWLVEWDARLSGAILDGIKENSLN